MVLQRRMAMGALAVSMATAMFFGPEWVEDGDAGRLPSTAQRTTGAGEVDSIRGQLEGLRSSGSARGLDPDDFEDL